MAKQKAETTASASDAKKRQINPVFLVIPVVVLLVVAVGAASYFYLQYNSVLKNAPAAGGEKELTSVVQQIGKLIVLPTGETPKLATVTDIAKLKDQQFFRSAQNGDKVLIFAKAQKAYLYRPTTNQIVEVGPISLSQETERVAGASTISQAPKNPVAVTVYNGTSTVGLAKTVQKALEDKKLPIAVVGLGNAVKNDYQKTIVVDLTGKNNDVASSLATALNGEVGEFPEGESKPDDSEILVILGANAQ